MVCGNFLALYGANLNNNIYIVISLEENSATDVDNTSGVPKAFTVLSTLCGRLSE